MLHLGTVCTPNEDRLVKTLRKDEENRKFSRPVTDDKANVTVLLSLALLKIEELVSGCTSSILQEFRFMTRIAGLYF